MKKKIMALILTLAFLPTFFVPQAAFAARADASDMVAFMNQLDIISSSESTGDKLDAPVTRINFALFIARALGIDDSVASGKTYFNDIPDDHWAVASINKLVEIGIISDGEKNFRPEDIITKEEAAKIAVTCIGANGEADMYGGYPNGYLTIASREKLFAGCESASEMTVRNAAILIYNMLNAEIVQMEISGEDLTFSRTGDTLLSIYHGIYKAKGTIEAVYGISIDENKVNKQDEVIIGGETYSSAYWLYDYLGMNKEFYYQDDDGDKTVVYVIESSDKNTEVTYISSEDYVGFKDGYVEYYYDADKGTTKKVKISDGAVVLRNGDNDSADLEAAFSDFYGNMRIIDTGKLDGAETIIIEDYKTIVISHVDGDDYAIYDTYDQTLFADLSDEDGEVIKYFDVNGNEMTFSNLVSDGVVNVAASLDGNFTIVIINNNNIVTGIIDGKGTDADGERYLELDGEKYPVQKSFFDKFENLFTVGASGTFKTDMFGKIASYAIDKGEDGFFAYLINGYVDSQMEGEDLDGERFVVKMFTEYGEYIRKACAEKVKIDGVTIKGSDKIMEILSTESGVTSQLVYMKYNKDGEIKYIDTQNYNEASEGKYSLRKQENSKNIYKHWMGMLGHKAYAPSTTKVMVIPSEGSEKTAESNRFSMKTLSNIAAGHYYRMDVFQLDPDSLTVDMVVYYGEEQNDIDTYSKLYVVEEISDALNEDDQTVKCFTLNADGTKGEYLISPQYVIKSSTSAQYIDPEIVGVGDIVRIGTNYKNEITNMQLMFDYSVAEADGDYNFFTNSIASTYRIKDGILPNGYENGFKLSYGYVSRTNGNTFMWGYAKPGDSDEIYNPASYSSTKVIVVDMENKRDLCRTGTVSELIGYYQSASSFSKIITIARDCAMSQIIIYK